MTGHDRFLARLKNLPADARAAELRQAVTDSLQGLVACVEHALPAAADAPHSCVIDDFEILQTDLTETECRLLLRYSASARLYAKARGDHDRVSGKAEAVIDAAGRVTYRGATYAKERAFDPPDIGGGD